MKPCSKNRKPIAWLVLDALDPMEAAKVRTHLARCDGCRRYWQEISTVQRTLAASAPTPDIEANDSFHEKLAARLAAGDSVSAAEKLGSWLGRTLLNWRVALPASAAILVLVFVSLAWKHTTSSSKASVQAGSSASEDPSPTIGNYQIIASQSLEKFAALLDRQGDKPLPRAPVYTAGGSLLAN